MEHSDALVGRSGTIVEISPCRLPWVIAMRRAVHLGAWTIFCDIAGQVSESPDNPIVTVAAVGVAREVLRQIRGRLVRSFNGTPTKWKRGGLSGAARIAALTVAYRLPTAVAQCHRSTEKWSRFYTQATKFRSKARMDLDKPLGYLDGNEVMRMYLMGQGFSQLVGRLLKDRHPWGDRRATLDLEVVIDTDMHEAETRQQFKEALQEWAVKSRLHEELEVEPSITCEVQTEQEEPLLLFPDYIAGIYQHADPRARLGHPVASPDDASRLVQELRLRLGSRLYENPEDFAQEYPLDHDGERVTRRGQRNDC